MVAEDFEAVLKGKYPGKAHAKRVVQMLREKGAATDGILYLEGRHTKMIEDNDGPEPFRYVILYPTEPCVPRLDY